ncbi:MAG: hypothetical protein LBP72_01770 [Dysgonamonadaceae bacterium]|nr:hypothetical protein [Dysgonamonadaceae bacterium]
MDDLTGEIKNVLDAPNEQVDIEKAALLLLKLNRNRILYESIVRRKNVEKLKYELQKIYNYRMLDDAAKESKTLEKTAVTVVQKTFPKAEKREATETKGMRPDHEQLPEEIKAKYTENLNIFPRMRKLHEHLKLMNNALPCDRYPLLKELKELDEQLRRNWDEYDAFAVVPPAPPTGDTPPATVPDAKEISAARKYLSDNKAKLAELRQQDDQSKYLALLDKMQQRLDLLLKANAGISDEQLAELTGLGLYA